MLLLRHGQELSRGKYPLGTSAAFPQWGCQSQAPERGWGEESWVRG